MWRLRVKFGDRLLLVVPSVREAEMFFHRRLALQREHDVKHLECWIYSSSGQVERGFTADFDETGNLFDGITDADPETAA